MSFRIAIAVLTVRIPVPINTVIPAAIAIPLMNILHSVVGGALNVTAAPNAANPMNTPGLINSV